MPRSALISGAGIAGLTLAFWLTEAGWEVTVVERAKRLRSNGYPIDIRGAAVEVVDRMRLLEQITADRYRHPLMDFLTPGGRRLARLDLGEVLNDPDAGDIEITRGALTRILYDASATRADYVFGDTITALSPTDSGVDVTFRHRGPETFDVAIGADGIHSNVRALTFGEENHFLRHLGPYVAIWDIPTAMIAPGTGYVYSHPGRTVAIERTSGSDTTRAFLTFVHPAPGSVNRHDIAEIAAELRRAFAEDRWRTDEIIDTVCDAEDVFFDTASQVRMNRWGTGRVVLAGDAAYAPAFLSGQGTSLAIAGAYVLAGELVRHDRPEEAFEAYERRMRHFVERNQNLALRTDGTVLSRTRRQLLRRNIVVAMTPWLHRVGLDRLLRTEHREATTDLSLSDTDLQRCPSRQA